MINYNTENIIENDFSSYDEIFLINLGDLHIGNHCFNKKLFKETLDFIDNTDNVRVILSGDLIENNTKNSVGNVLEQTITPREQIELIVEYFKPFKDKIIASVSGNHEDRRDARNADIDWAELIAGKLGVPYNPFSTINYIGIGQDHRKKNRPIYYSIHTTHSNGGTGGRTAGGAVNASVRSDNMVSGMDVYFSGHTHTQSVFNSVDRVFYHQSKSVREVHSKFVVTGAYLDYSLGGYSAKSSLKPQKQGALGVLLTGGEKTITVMDIPSAKRYFTKS
jgi:predicted phosphodiesterase